jgi:hypothetical protein
MLTAVSRCAACASSCICPTFSRQISPFLSRVGEGEFAVERELEKMRLRASLREEKAQVC